MSIPPPTPEDMALDLEAEMKDEGHLLSYLGRASIRRAHAAEAERDRLRAALARVIDLVYACYKTNNLRWETSACEKRLVAAVNEARAALKETEK